MWYETNYLQINRLIGLDHVVAEPRKHRLQQIDGRQVFVRAVRLGGGHVSRCGVNGVLADLLKQLDGTVEFLLDKTHKLIQVLEVLGVELLIFINRNRIINVIY